MLSTLFLLLLMGIFSQSVIKISSNYIIQLNQLSSTYQAKTAINLAKKNLKDHVEDNDGKLPKQGEVTSSAGNIKIQYLSKGQYNIVLTQKNGTQYKTEFNCKKKENIEKIEEIEEVEEVNEIEEVEEIDLQTTENEDEIESMQSPEKKLNIN